MKKIFAIFLLAFFAFSHVFADNANMSMEKRFTYFLDGDPNLEDEKLHQLALVVADSVSTYFLNGDSTLRVSLDADSKGDLFRKNLKQTRDSLFDFFLKNPNEPLHHESWLNVGINYLYGNLSEYDFNLIYFIRKDFEKVFKNSDCAFRYIPENFDSLYAVNESEILDSLKRSPLAINLKNRTMLLKYLYMKNNQTMPEEDKFSMLEKIQILGDSLRIVTGDGTCNEKSALLNSRHNRSDFHIYLGAAPYYAQAFNPSKYRYFPFYGLSTLIGFNDFFLSIGFAYGHNYGDELHYKGMGFNKHATSSLLDAELLYRLPLRYGYTQRVVPEVGVGFSSMVDNVKFDRGDTVNVYFFHYSIGICYEHSLQSYENRIHNEKGFISGIAVAFSSRFNYLDFVGLKLEVRIGMFLM